MMLWNSPECGRVWRKRKRVSAYVKATAAALCAMAVKMAEGRDNMPYRRGLASLVGRGMLCTRRSMDAV